MGCVRWWQVGSEFAPVSGSGWIGRLRRVGWSGSRDRIDGLRKVASSESARSGPLLHGSNQRSEPLIQREGAECDRSIGGWTQRSRSFPSGVGRGAAGIWPSTAELQSRASLCRKNSAYAATSCGRRDGRARSAPLSGRVRGWPSSSSSRRRSDERYSRGQPPTVRGRECPGYRAID